MRDLNDDYPETAGESLLETNAWMRLVSRYLTCSIRVGAYAANMHFLSMINSSVDRFISTSVVRTLVYLVYSAVIYEIGARIVKICFKPKFVCATEYKNQSKQPSDILVLSEKDYTYRLATEKMIYESLLYYGFNLVVAIMLCNIITVEAAGKHIGLGLLGAFVSVLNFIGVVIVASSGTSFSFKKTPVYAAVCGFVTPLVLYVGYAFRCAFWG